MITLLSIRYYASITYKKRHDHLICNKYLPTELLIITEVKRQKNKFIVTKYLTFYKDFFMMRVCNGIIKKKHQHYLCITIFGVIYTYNSARRTRKAIKL